MTLFGLQSSYPNKGEGSAFLESRERSRISPNSPHGEYPLQTDISVNHADSYLRRTDITLTSADGPREACGVVGVYHKSGDAARVAFFGVYTLQHRGQESAGIASADGERIRVRTKMGLVTQSFSENDLDDLPGHLSIAHTRYSTTGSNRIVNAQPILARGPDVELALAHNGNVINALELRREMEDRGFRFAGTNDSEIIASVLANAPAQDWGGRISYLMRRLQGAYSLTVLTKDGLLGIRDSLGVRPPVHRQTERRPQWRSQRMDNRVRILRPRPRGSGVHQGYRTRRGRAC